MWKIREKNQLRIYSFTDKFVEEILEWACENQGIKDETEIWDTDIKRNLKLLFDDGRMSSLRKAAVKLSNCKDIKKIRCLFIFFTNKYEDLIRGDLKVPNVLTEKTLELLNEVFQYFYNGLLDSKKFWETYNSKDNYLSKKQVREKFGKNKICPYCDQIDMSSSLTTNIDHYLPMSKFPLLGIYWKNLILSCSICNGIQFKNNIWKAPVLHPYFDKIEDYIYISFDRDNKNIKVNNSTSFNKVVKTASRKKMREMLLSNERTNNLINTFKFDEIYKGKWRLVEAEKKELSEKILRKFNYHDSVIEKKDIYAEIVKTSIKTRQIELKEGAGTIPAAKLKYDYGNDFDKNCSKDIIEWIIKEHSKLVIKK